MAYDLSRAFLVEQNVKMTYDPEADAAYVLFSTADAAQTLALRDEFGEMTGEIILDLDDEGRMIGIEILNARKRLGL